MVLGVIKEDQDGRVAMIPSVLKTYTEAPSEVMVEKGAGESSSFSDESFSEVGAKIATRQEVLSKSDIIISLHPIPTSELTALKKGTVLVTLYQAYFDDSNLKEVSKHPLTVLSMDMIPRSTLAQAMDILSSMASIAGYKAVLMAANHLPKYFPMLSSAAGTIRPSKVLVIGAGVAGLQAIATAKRIGAVVEAFDTRAAVKEEVQSLGAKFVEVEGAKDDKDAGGYAVEQTEEYKKRQSELIQEKASQADVIIATAQIRGRKAPLLITEDTLKNMKTGSVIVDLAASTGGNCACCENGKAVVKHGVTIIGDSNLASSVPVHGSELFSKNIANYLKLIIKEGVLKVDLENEIVKSTCLLFEGNEPVKE